MIKMPAITQEHLEDTQHIIDSIPEEKPHCLNLADDRQYRYMKTLYSIRGYTQERYPMRFKLLEERRTQDLANNKPGSPQLDTSMVQDGDTRFGTLCKITSVGTSGGGENACATAFISVDGGATSITLDLQIYDYTGGTLGALITSNTNNISVATNFLSIQAIGGTPTASMLAMLTYSYTPTNGNPNTPSVITMLTKSGQQDPTVTEPVQKDAHKGQPNITIALSRGPFSRNNDDVDYWFHTGQWDNTQVVVPLVGQVTFPNTIQLPLTSSLVVNLTVALQSGGVCTTPANMSDVLDAFSIGPDGKTLCWNLAAGTGGAKGNPVYYGNAPWNSDTVTYLFCAIGVLTGTNLLHDWAFIQSTDVADEIDNDGIKYIKPLQFLWHCLAEGTLITLADGSTLPIEAVDNNCDVRIDNSGGTLPVRATSQAPARGGEVLTLKTDKGQELTLSDGHVVMTPEKPLQAGELKVGDTVVVLDGEASITAIERKDDYKGTLINLHLGNLEELGSIPENGTTLFAGGIQVGDHLMQSRYLKIARTNKDYVLARLPSEWHTDYLSSLEDSATSEV